ncbi:hypothetical protein [Thioalkalivibrio sp. ALE11]|uniref:hypothetical protein n=1 Tax=Thioalkalivibrio sp. ALE11 TaxID=1265494 RepID=UPI00036ABB1A|nr:hypothetical protein [Thioalkalivibrio sp. ALE11]
MTRNPATRLLLLAVLGLLLALPPATWAESGDGTTAAETTSESMKSLREDWQQRREQLQRDAEEGDETARERTRDTLDAMDDTLQRLHREASETWDDLADTTRENRDRALQALDDERDALAAWYDDMELRSGRAGGSIREGSRKAWEGVRDGSREAWGGVREGSREVWDGVRDGSRDAWDGVRDAFGGDDAPDEGEAE